MIIHAKVALLAVLSSFTWSLILWIRISEDNLALAFTLCISLLMHFVLAVKSHSSLKSVTWRAYMLGSFFSVGFNVILLAPTLFLSTGMYICILSLFHIGEYLSTALFNPSSLSLGSFILNHSFEYNMALVVSWVEHFVLMYFIPGIKTWTFFIYFGLVLCLTGDTFRKIAMYTAGKNFNHLVQYYKHDNHVLITSGVYSIFRHPSYTGWFCWSVGTQVLLCNPICLVGYTIASWKFFQERIELEEITLLNFFGSQYVDYKKKVHSGIPFVEGYKLKSL